jgi:hypothetical protein
MHARTCRAKDSHVVFLVAFGRIIGAPAPRLIELTHRAVPYPVLLFTARVESASVSAAHKRWSQSEAGKTVLHGEVIEAQIGSSRDGSVKRGVIRRPLAFSGGK